MYWQHCVQQSLSPRGINTLSCGPFCLRVSLWPARVVEAECVYVCVSVWECWGMCDRGITGELATTFIRKKQTQTLDKLNVQRIWLEGEVSFSSKYSAVDLSVHLSKKHCFLCSDIPFYLLFFYLAHFSFVHLSYSIFSQNDACWTPQRGYQRPYQPS